MPFNTAQLVLKKVLPEQTFNSLYNKACNAYDVYQRVKDNTVWIGQCLYYILKNDEQSFIRINTVQKVLGHTMVSRKGVLATYDITCQALKLEGCFVECGVARGGCSALMALIAERYDKGRKTWMFDSFEGMPPQSVKDGEQKPVRHSNKTASDLAQGYCLGTFNEVEQFLFKDLKLKRKNIFMVKGWFNETLPQYKSKIGDIAVLRLDGDWYESTKCCLANLYNNVVKGGYVIIDDYHLQGCKLAVDEFIDTLLDKPKMINDVKDGRSYLIK